jgi:hypothetical protein
MFIILEHIAYKEKFLVCDWSSCSSGLVEAAYYSSIIANMGKGANILHFKINTKQYINATTLKKVLNFDFNLNLWVCKF